MKYNFIPIRFKSVFYLKKKKNMCRNYYLQILTQELAKTSCEKPKKHFRFIDYACH